MTQQQRYPEDNRTNMPFDPRTLIASLPPFDPAQASRFTGYHDFCRFYQLQFGDLSRSQHLGQLGLAGEQIAVHLFRPQLNPAQSSAPGTLLIVHGYLDHHGLYRHIIRYALQHQLNVIAFDLPGHGLSSGPRAAIDSFEHYQRVLAGLLHQLDRWQLAGPLHLLGQSTGAAILNHYLLSQRPAIDGDIVLLAPLVRPRRWPLVRVGHRLLRPWKGSVKRDFAPNSHDPAFNTFLPQDPLQSAVITSAWVGAMKRWLPQFLALPAANYRPLLVQGQQDATVDWRYNLRVLEQKFPARQSLLITDARHQLANESAPIRTRYLDWLNQQGFAQSNVERSNVEHPNRESR